MTEQLQPKIVMNKLETKILESLHDKKIFIGYFMLCRYLNDRGYTRHGCNAGYEGPFKPKSNPKNKIYPCKVLCADSKVYYSRVRYFSRKMSQNNLLYLQKCMIDDSINTDIPWYRNADRLDIFVIIARSAIDFQKWWNENKKVSWRQISI